MFIIELILKSNPLALSVRRKEEAEATALYQKILDAIRAPQPQMLELTCDKQTEKKLAILSTEVSAVQMIAEKSAASAGAAAGFFRG